MTAEKTPLLGRFFHALGWALLVLGLVLSPMAWLAPNHYPPWTSFHGEAFAFAALGALCLAALMSGRAVPPLPVASGFALALIGLVWAQWASGQIASQGDALLSSLYLGGLALALWLGRFAAAAPWRNNAESVLAAVVVAAALISTYIALMQWLRLESLWGIFAAERGPGMRPFGNLGQPNHLATLVLMASPLAALLALRGHLKPWQLAVVLVSLGLGMVLSESRSGRLSAAAMGLYLLWSSPAHRKAPLARAVVLWWAGLVLLWFARDAASDGLLLQPVREAQMTQDAARTVMWTQMVAAIQASPWVGYGWRQTIVAQKVGALAQSGLLVTDYAHNFLLDVLLWVGIPLGLLLLALTAGWLLRVAVRARADDRYWLFASLIPFMVHSQFEFPFAYAYFLFPVACVLGFIACDPPSPSLASTTGPWYRSALWIGVLTWLALCTLVARDYLRAEEDYRVMRFELRKVGQRPSGYEAPELPWLTQLRDLLEAGRIKPRAGMSERELRLLEQVNQSQGWAMLHLSYIAALGLNGRSEQARAELERLRALYGDVTYGEAVKHLRELQAEPGFGALRTLVAP